MEEQYQNPEPDISVITNQVPPQPIKKNKSGMKWLLIVILLLLIAGVAGFFLTQSQTSEEETSPTPFVEETTPQPEPTEEPKPVDKKDISIEVQNGTGVAGEAGFLQKELQKLGYKEIKVGNAETQDATTTTATFSSDTGDSVKEEITTMLKSIYKSVEVKTSSSLKNSDILIVTGSRKGVTASSTPKASTSPKPTASATPKPSASPSPTASPSN